MTSTDLPTADYLDSLVDEDPLRLRDEAWGLVRKVERLRAELGRVRQWKADVLREAAHEIESRYPENIWLPDSDSPDAQAAKGVRVACKQLRHMADEIDAEAAATA